LIICSWLGVLGDGTVGFRKFSEISQGLKNLARELKIPVFGSFTIVERGRKTRNQAAAVV